MEFFIQFMAMISFGIIFGITLGCLIWNVCGKINGFINRLFGN